MKTRTEVVELAKSWLGKNEEDGSYKEIIDIYNSYTGKLPRGLKMDYSWAWCAATWSALAIKLGYTDIMPIEMSCAFLIDQAKKMDIWVEEDNIVPEVGDAVLYSWTDPAPATNNKNRPNHVGVVSYVSEKAGYFEVIEGNYDNRVKKRTVSINGRYIRGFIKPKYDNVEHFVIPGASFYNLDESVKSVSQIAHEVIAGKWGNGRDRQEFLSICPYGYETIQNEVNRILNGDAITTDNPNQSQRQPYEKTIMSTCFAKVLDESVSGTYVTTANLYCRNDAGTNKKALCLIPSGTRVKCYGYYTESSNVKWLYIQFMMDGVKYIGFSCSRYLKKVV